MRCRRAGRPHHRGDAWPPRLTVLTGCSGGASDDTLSPINGSAGTAPSVATPSGSGADRRARPSTRRLPASGSSRSQVRSARPASTRRSASIGRRCRRPTPRPGRASMPTCTPLDGGDTSQGVDVTVVDLRRLGAATGWSRPCSTSMAAPAAGEHDATLAARRRRPDDDDLHRHGRPRRGRRRAARSQMTDAGGNAAHRLVRLRRSAVAHDDHGARHRRRRRGRPGHPGADGARRRPDRRGRLRASARRGGGPRRRRSRRRGAA